MKKWVDLTQRGPAQSTFMRKSEIAAITPPDEGGATGAVVVLRNGVKLDVSGNNRTVSSIAKDLDLHATTA